MAPSPKTLNDTPSTGPSAVAASGGEIFQNLEEEEEEEEETAAAAAAAATVVPAVATPAVAVVTSSGGAGGAAAEAGGGATARGAGGKKQMAAARAAVAVMERLQDDALRESGGVATVSRKAKTTRDAMVRCLPVLLLFLFMPSPSGRYWLVGLILVVLLMIL